jgi:hypothetical protein
VQLGFFIDNNWNIDPRDGLLMPLLSRRDKNEVRKNIIRNMYICGQHKVSKQYIRCITAMSNQEFEEDWPTLMSDIDNALES